jgi:hypothetical protein
VIYTNLTRTAMTIACRAHQGQLDKAGFPYIHHPLHVAEQMTEEYTCAAALLHDVMEDTPVTAEQLRAAGIPDPVVEALTLLCHDPDVPYLDYVRRLKDNPIARAVKLADLGHNSDVSRLDSVTPRDEMRLERYRRAMALLEEK